MSLSDGGDVEVAMLWVSTGERGRMKLTREGDVCVAAEGRFGGGEGRGGGGSGAGARASAAAREPFVGKGRAEESCAKPGELWATRAATKELPADEAAGGEERATNGVRSTSGEGGEKKGGDECSESIGDCSDRNGRLDGRRVVSRNGGL
jgi:hypothetical protein